MVNLDRLHGLLAVAALRDDLDVGDIREPQLEAAARERFVVDDEGSDLRLDVGVGVHSRIALSSNGKRSTTSAPIGLRFRTVKVWRSPYSTRRRSAVLRR